MSLITRQIHYVRDIPECVRRFFRLAICDDTRIIERAHVLHTGEFRIGGRNSRWLAFSSTELFTIMPTGFVWDADVRLLPGVQIHVTDRYAEGTASMKATLFRAVPLANEHGSVELATGALQRYLAEAVWFPSALLPEYGIEWTAVGHSAAQATLRDGKTTAELRFDFGSNGEIVRAFAPNRNRFVGHKYVPTPWACRYSEYAERHGFVIPTKGEVEWQLNEGSAPYWRGEIVAITYTLGEHSGQPHERLRVA